MKFLHIVLAVVLSAGLLFIARTNSRGRPEHFITTNNGYTFEITTVPKAYETDLVRIKLGIRGDLDSTIRPEFRFGRFGQDAKTPLYKYDSRPLLLEDSASGLYYTEQKAGELGGKLWYYFEVRDKTGGLRATFTRPDGKPFVLKYVGHVPLWALICHIFFIFATVFFVAKGSLHAVDLLRGREDAGPTARAYMWAAVCAFIGGYPFGFPMNWYTFGTIWEGVPFGTDATDNKTQLLFVYLLFVMVSSLGTLTRGRFGRNAFSKRMLGGWGVLGFFVMLGIYLIPHSIQFEPGLTKAVCWSWIGLVVLIYGAGLTYTLKHPRSDETIERRGKKAQQ